MAGVLKTDQNGQAESEELLIGSYNEKGIKELFQYEVVETKAPEGYQLDSRPHPVTFDLEGEKDFSGAGCDQSENPNRCSKNRG